VPTRYLINSCVMMGWPGPCLLLLVVASVAGEYTWTGTDWKWQNPEDTKDPVLAGGVADADAEGSGDDDDYDYEEEEDYDDYPPVHKQSGQLPTLELPEKTPKKTPKKTVVKTPTFGFDDEDLSEGSGGFDDEDDDMEEGSGVGGGFGGNSWRETVTQPPRRVEEPFRPNVVNPAEEEEEELYVDGNNYNQYVPPKEDVFFGRDDKEDSRNRVVVSTTEKTRKHYDAKPTESPEVHRIPPTRNVSFFAQPGILAAVIGGAVVGLLCAILLVMFIVYRMRKKDEGSYALDEPKRAHNANSYSKPPSREFYA